MKLDINKYNNGLWKFKETNQSSKIKDKICLNYEILWTEICIMSPKIFLKVEIWAVIFLPMKFHG